MILLVNFVGSRMSSTEKGVLWLSGNLAASGCISALCGRIRTQVELSVPVLMRALYMGLQPLHTPLERMQIYISFKKKSYPNEAMRPAGTIAASVFPARTRRHAPAPWDPRVGTSKCKCPLSAGGGGEHWAGYLLLGIWLKCAPFHSPRVPYCAFACHYLQMWDFTLVGHVNAGCDANLWTHQRESLRSFSPLSPSFHRAICPVEGNIPTKHCGLIRSPPTTLWELIIDFMVPHAGLRSDIRKSDSLKVFIALLLILHLSS